MKGALLAAGLLLTVLAFALAFVPRNVALGSAFAAVVTTIAAAALSEIAQDLAFIGCWISLAVAALSVYWPRVARDNPWLCAAFAANAGVWAGMVSATEGHDFDVFKVLPVLLLGIPAAWCVSREWAIVPRVVTSWILAVAILVGAIPHLVVHPGYEPDHHI